MDDLSLYSGAFNNPGSMADKSCQELSWYWQGEIPVLNQTATNIQYFDPPTDDGHYLLEVGYVHLRTVYDVLAGIFPQKTIQPSLFERVRAWVKKLAA